VSITSIAFPWKNFSYTFPKTGKSLFATTNVSYLYLNSLKVFIAGKHGAKHKIYVKWLTGKATPTKVSPLGILQKLLLQDFS